MTAEERARRIRLLLLDVDGVLTDGRIYYSERGDELKAFHIQDGLGIKLLQRQGIRVGIITARTSSLLARRAEELGIDPLIQGREDKAEAFSRVLEETGYSPDQTAFMGDDLPDLAVMARAGMALTVADCARAVAGRVHWQATRCGGRGAVREAAEFILAARGELEAATEAYLP